MKKPSENKYLAPKKNKSRKKKKPKKRKKGKMSTAQALERLTMDDYLKWVDMDLIQSSIRISRADKKAVLHLHDLLRSGKTWEDWRVRGIFAQLPNTFPFGLPFVHNEVLIKTGKAKIVGASKIADGREILIYRVICSTCHGEYICTAPFRQNHCQPCREGRLDAN